MSYGRARSSSNLLANIGIIARNVQFIHYILAPIHHIIYGFYSSEIVADSGYGSEQNYEFLFANGMTPYVKYNMFHKEMKRKFLSKTARSQLQTIAFFRDPFKLVPVNNIAEIADKFTRNEILTSNEIRQIIGMKPSDDPKADELRNSNISQSKEEGAAELEQVEEEPPFADRPVSEIMP